MTPAAGAEPVAVVLLAAGASRRMRGADKLLEPVGGIPVLRHAALAALAAGLPVTAVLAPGWPERAAALDGLALRIVTADRAAEGMALSLRAGVAAAPEGHAVIVALADMPEIGPEDYAALCAAARAHPGRCLRATDSAGAAGHPVLFPAVLRPALARLEGDAGARDILRAHPPLPVVLEGRRATTDLDTPEA
ncbi:MAG: NTP transferase domain-containing protein, partial [Gemmobacter sp.]